MCGLNPCTLPCALPEYQEEINKMNVKHEEKNLKPNLAKPKQGWKVHTNKKGKKNKYNKKPKVEETDIDENQYSRLTDMVGDMNEVTQLLCEAVKNQNNGNGNIESKNKEEIKSYHADTVEMSTLNETIQSCVESDQHEREEGSNKSTEEKESECAQTHVCVGDSDIQNMRYCADESQSYSEDSDCCSTSSSDAGSIESNFEDWLKRKTKCKHRSCRD